MIELKPCPFCAGLADLNMVSIIKNEKNEITFESHWNISCDTCGATSSKYSSIQDAIKAWNMRDGSGAASAIQEENPMLAVNPPKFPKGRW